MILSIPLEKNLHDIYTKRWRKEFPYGTTYDLEDILKAAIRIYKDTPELLV